MNKIRFSVVIASVIVLAFSCVTATAGSFVYEAVPYVLIDPNTPDQPYTISGTFTTNCNDCNLISPSGLIDWDIEVDGPVPFNSTPENVNTIFLFGEVIATPTQIVLEPSSGTNGISNLFFFSVEGTISWERFDPGNTIFYNDNSSVNAVANPIGDNVVVATFIPEPSSSLLLLLALSCLSLLRARR